MNHELACLYEELFYLDEIAGELSPEENARTDARRNEIKQEIKDMESLGSAHHTREPETNDNWYEEQFDLDTDYL